MQPLNRLARRRLDEIAEYQCDDWAAQTTGEPVAMARCLAEVAAWLVPSPSLADDPVPASGMARQACVAARIERLLSARTSWNRSRLAFAHVGLVCMAALVGAAGPRVLPQPRANEVPSTDNDELALTPPSGTAGRIAAILDNLSLVREELLSAEQALGQLLAMSRESGLPDELHSTLQEAGLRVAALRERRDSLEQAALDCLAISNPENATPPGVSRGVPDHSHHSTEETP